jgi:hypothetical protein
MVQHKRGMPIFDASCPFKYRQGSARPWDPGSRRGRRRRVVRCAGAPPDILLVRCFVGPLDRALVVWRAEAWSTPVHRVVVSIGVCVVLVVVGLAVERMKLGGWDEGGPVLGGAVILVLLGLPVMILAMIVAAIAPRLRGRG